MKYLIFIPITLLSFNVALGDGTPCSMAQVRQGSVDQTVMVRTTQN